MLVTVLIRILETLFVAGTIGSCLVLVLSGIEDLETLFGFGHKQGSAENKEQTPAS
ncbi:MAG TPA: hypothetical protein VFI95_25025 [Terriglobales bacterium]|nr:hypothetical protein [Terriglobales bacterium]